MTTFHEYLLELSQSLYTVKTHEALHSFTTAGIRVVAHGLGEGRSSLGSNARKHRRGTKKGCITRFREANGEMVSLKDRELHSTARLSIAAN